MTVCLAVAVPDGMQAHFFAPHREPFESAAAVQIGGAGRNDKIVSFSGCVHVGRIVALIAGLCADIPGSDTPDEFGNHGNIAQEETLLPESGAVHQVQVKEDIARLDVVAQGDVVDHLLPAVLHEVDTPYSLPPGSELTAPGQIIGINILETERKRRIADLSDQILVLRHLVGRRGTERKTLIKVIAEFAVEINVNDGTI